MKTLKHRLLFAAVLSVVWLAGCATPATRIRSNPEAFTRLNPDQQALIKAGQVGIGMDMSAVTLAVGKPDRVKVQTDADGQRFIWRYVDNRYGYGGYPYWGWGGGWRHGGWGGGYYGHGYWGGGAHAYGPSQDVDRLRIVFKNGVVSSIEQVIR